MSMPRALPRSSSALGQHLPHWFHCSLVRDVSGQRLAKRAAGLTIRELRAAGRLPHEIIAELAVLDRAGQDDTSLTGLVARLSA